MLSCAPVKLFFSAACLGNRDTLKVSELLQLSKAWLVLSQERLLSYLGSWLWQTDAGCSTSQEVRHPDQRYVFSLVIDGKEDAIIFI